MSLKCNSEEQSVLHSVYLRAKIILVHMNYEIKLFFGQFWKELYEEETLWKK